MGAWAPRLVAGVAILLAAAVVAFALVNTRGGRKLPVSRDFENPAQALDVLSENPEQPTVATAVLPAVYITDIDATANRDGFTFVMHMDGDLSGVADYYVSISGGNDPAIGDTQILNEHGVVVNRSASTTPPVAEEGSDEPVAKVAEYLHSGPQAVPVAEEDRVISIDVDANTVTIEWAIGSSMLVSEDAAPMIDGRWQFHLAAQGSAPEEAAVGLVGSSMVLTYVANGWDLG